MSRYIDADAFEVFGYTTQDGSFDDGVQFVLEKIDEQPTADVVEVVRCEDCKHGNYFVDAHTDNYGTSVKAKVYCRIWQDWVSANGYCFLADRRERREDVEIH